MNDKFFELPVEKQKAILNAAYKAFSENEYKKVPTSVIADSAGISKPLLFHYFTNKKELYMYLWNNALILISDASIKAKVMETDDLFEMLIRSNIAKCSLMKKYPYVYAFSMMAYYETDEEIKSLIGESYDNKYQMSERIVLESIDKSHLRKDVPLNEIYETILYAIDGYMLKQYRSGNIIPDQIQKDMEKFIIHFKKIYST